jgi:hypothetical protein
MDDKVKILTEQEALRRLAQGSQFEDTGKDDDSVRVAGYL